MTMPKYGYGKGGRPLWSPRDRDAEGIRVLLRKAGFRDYRDNGDGFTVEGANSSEAGPEPYTISYLGERQGILNGYRRTLLAAGLAVEDGWAEGLLLVAPSPGWRAPKYTTGRNIVLVVAGALVLILCCWGVVSVGGSGKSKAAVLPAVTPASTWDGGDLQPYLPDQGVTAETTSPAVAARRSEGPKVGSRLRRSSRPAPRRTSEIRRPVARKSKRPAPRRTAAYYKNCTDVRNHGAAPIYRGQPGYSRKLDRDGDGVACE